ncbi:hypothetical protein ACLOJK_037062 [Asimina triloba]
MRGSDADEDRPDLLVGWPDKLMGRWRRDVAIASRSFARRRIHGNRVLVMAWTACRWSMLMKFSGSWRRWGLPSFYPDQIFRLELAGDGFHGWLVEKMEHRISVVYRSLYTCSV